MNARCSKQVQVLVFGAVFALYAVFLIHEIMSGRFYQYGSIPGLSSNPLARYVGVYRLVATTGSPPTLQFQIEPDALLLDGKRYQVKRVESFWRAKDGPRLMSIMGRSRRIDDDRRNLALLGTQLVVQCSDGLTAMLDADGVTLVWEEFDAAAERPEARRQALWAPEG